MSRNVEVNRANQKAHYERHPEYYREKNAKARRIKAAWIREQKNVPCVNCGKRYPHYQMQFDHLDAALKTSPVSRMSSSSWKQIKEEVSKCEVVCVLCHAERTWLRSN